MSTTSCFKTALVLFVLGGAISGCSSIGERDFACPGRPPGVRCLSATEVYAATEGTAVVAATAGHALGDRPVPAANRKSDEPTLEEHRKNHSISPPNSGRTHQLIATGTVLPAIEKPVPIRTPSQVMRVWIAPWEDARGVLHAGGYSFIEIESRRWAFGEVTNSTEPVRFFSIQTTATTAVTGPSQPAAKGAPAKDPQQGTSERPKKTASSPSSNPGVSK